MANKNDICIQYKVGKKREKKKLSARASARFFCNIHPKRIGSAPAKQVILAGAVSRLFLVVRAFIFPGPD